MSNSVKSSLFHSNPALAGAVTFHGVAMLPRLRAMSFEELKTLGSQASAASNCVPLWMPLAAAESKRLVIDAWQPGVEQSGPFVIALMVFSLWVMVGENPDMCGALYETWPIAEAVALCPKGD